MTDLIERLRGYAEAEDLHVDERATLLEAAAALEAAREDAERLDWLADRMRITDLHYILGSVPMNPCDLRAAIDQAHDKGGADNGN